MIRLSELKLPLAEVPTEHRRAADAPTETDLDREPPPHPVEALTRLAAAALAVPATTPEARCCLEQAAFLFSAQRQESLVPEGSLRARSLQLRRLVHRLQISETVFFASASSRQREAIRVGTKWARRQQQMLRQVLA